MPEDSDFKGILNNLLSSIIIGFKDVKVKIDKGSLSYFKGVKRSNNFKKAFSSIKPKN